MAETIFMTAEGKKQLEERLKDLKVNGRAEMAEKIEAKLRNVQIIDEKVKGDKADVGSKIEIKDVKSGMTFEYTIVGTHESNPMEGRISNESPIGKAVIGKRKGDEAVVKAPMGDAVYKIIDIK